MARIIGLDYGRKKTGIAVTDPLQIIVSPLTTISTIDLIEYLEEYIGNEEVEKIVIGEPLHADGTKSDNHEEVIKFSDKLKTLFPKIEVELQDEYLTSKLAKEIIIKSVPSRKKRRDKSLVDKISATLILQDYLKHF